MKISGGLKENGIVIGNTYDKYGSHNPIIRKIMEGFDSALSGLVSKAAPKSIHEIGCGEGFWVLQWNQKGMSARGSDFSSRIIDLARMNAASKGVSPSLFDVRSIYELDSDRDKADLVVCCEVLEHLEWPEDGLRALQRVVGQYLILSVPHEPVWRALNLARGKYIADFGNTPGHIQHWSRRGFVAFVSKCFEVVEVKTPLPWIMLLCRPRK